MTDYDALPERVRWYLENFDHLGLAEMLAGGDTKADAGTPLVCSDERHAAKVAALEAQLADALAHTAQLERVHIRRLSTYVAWSRHMRVTCWRCRWVRCCPEGARLEAAYDAAVGEVRTARLSIRASAGDANRGCGIGRAAQPTTGTEPAL